MLSDKLEYGKVQDNVYFNKGFNLEFSMSNYQDDKMLKELSNTLKEQFGEDRIKKAFDFKTLEDVEVDRCKEYYNSMNCNLQEVGEDVEVDRCKEYYNSMNCNLQEVGEDVWLMNNNKPTSGKIYERNTELNRADSKTVIITYTVKLPSGEYVKTKEVFKTKDDLFVALSKELYNV